MSNNKTNINPVEEKKYSPEEIAKMRKNMIKFYTDELPFLKLEEKYERLLADIEEHKVRKIVAVQKQAYIYAQAQAADAEERRQATEASTGDKKQEGQESSTTNNPNHHNLKDK